MRYCFDIDDTICKHVSGDYNKSEPYRDRIEKVNKLYDEGNYIMYFTARGMGRYEGDAKKATDAFWILTNDQLKSWGCKYHELILGKPHVDIFVDDKGINSEDFFK